LPNKNAENRRDSLEEESQEGKIKPSVRANKRIVGLLDVGCWMLDVGCWMLDVGIEDACLNVLTMHSLI